MNNLENQHESMKTVVETFIIEETEKLIYNNEELDKWNKHVEELGLVGQTKIRAKDKSPIPFMHLKKGMVNMFHALCPREVPVEEYDVTPIPVEILDLISLSKQEKYFQKMEIWYDESTPDPVCVGITSSFYCYGPGYSTIETTKGMTKEQAIQYQSENADVKGISETDVKYYLLGKWADVKHSFVDLKEMARQRLIGEKTNLYNKAIKEAKSKIDGIEESVVDYLNGTTSYL